MSMDRKVTGVWVHPFEVHVSCNDPATAIQRGLDDFARMVHVPPGMMTAKDVNLLDVQQEPRGLREWDCPECGRERNYSTPSATVGICDGCEAQVDLAQVYAERDADQEKSTADFLAEVAQKLRHVAPAVSNMDGYHIERLARIARAFGWKGELD